MSKYLNRIVLVGLLFVSLGSAAQCPVSVSVTAIPDATTLAVCKSDSVFITANPSAGALTSTYSWLINGNVVSSDSVFSVYANNQTITLIMYTTTGCPVDTAVITFSILTVTHLPTVTIDYSYCNPPTADITITAAGGAAPYNYDLVGQGTSASGIYTNVPAGTYTLYTTDIAGCNDTNQIVVAPNVPNIQSTAEPLITECNQETADVQITTTGGTPPYSYDLQGVGQNTDGLFTDSPPGSYTLIVTDDQGCTDTSSVSIVPFICPLPEPNEVITPNGDGRNDFFVISFLQYYPNNDIYIFDRWGQRVYHKKNYDNVDGWDAKYLGTNMPVSTYYYVVKIYLEKSDDIVLKGPLSVFR